MLDGHRTALERAGVVHGRLDILGSLKLHVHADVIRKSTDKEVGPLLRRHAQCMACQGLEAVGEVLHRGGEGKAAELRQAAPANRRPKAKEAELAEALPRGMAPSSCSRV